MITIDELKFKLGGLETAVNDLRDALSIEASEKRLAELEHQMTLPGFYDDQGKSQKVISEMGEVKNKLERFGKLSTQYEEAQTLLEMIEEENDPSLAAEGEEAVNGVEKSIDELQLMTMLNGEYDHSNAILTFHAGTGGTEAQDWAEMLYRMYNKWAQAHGMTVEVLDYPLFRRNSQIRPVLIARIGSGYHANNLDTSFASATGIRSYLNGLADLYSDLSALDAWMPKSAFLTLCEALNAHPLMFEEDFAAMLGYCLVTHDSFTDYADGSLELSNRILRQREHFSSVVDFLDDLKTKEVTYTRLSRLLTHILLDIKEKDYGFYRNLDYVPYGKILGFREDAAPLLKELKQHSTIPLLTSPLDKKQQLDEAAQALLKKDVLASELYRMAAVQKSGFAIPNEYKRKFLRV